VSLSLPRWREEKKEFRGMDDKYYTYTWASSAEPASFIANALIQWLLWPLRVLLEVLTGSPFDNIVGVDPVESN
jgi:hypothetical protein